MELATKMIVGTIISAGKTVMASEYKDRATVEMGKKVNFTPVFKEQWQRKSDKVVKLFYHFPLSSTLLTPQNRVAGQHSDVDPCWGGRCGSLPVQVIFESWHNQLENWSCQQLTPLLAQDQPGQDEGHGGPPGAHRLRAARLVRGRRHDPHLQHVETCARRLEMGCETNWHSVPVLVFDWSEPNTGGLWCADSSQSARFKFMPTTQSLTLFLLPTGRERWIQWEGAHYQLNHKKSSRPLCVQGNPCC